MDEMDPSKSSNNTQGDEDKTENVAVPEDNENKQPEEPSSKPEQEPEPEPEPKPEKESEPESESKPEKEPEAEPESESKPEKEPEAEPESEPKLEKEAKPKEKKETKKKTGDPKAKTDTEENPDFKYMIRIANTNVDGNYSIPLGLTSVKGIGIRLGTAITDKLGLPRNKKIGDLTDDEVDALAEFVENLSEEFPDWMLNRQKDFDTGDSLHIISAEMQSVFRDDLNRLKKIRCYRGIRHEQGQKVRGQRTRANGRSGMTVGVQRKRVQQQQQKQKSGKSGK